MNTTREIVPAQWSETDERFFRVVAEVFPVAFLWGASELLASYDPEPAQLATLTASAAAASTLGSETSTVRA